MTITINESVRRGKRGAYVAVYDFTPAQAEAFDKQTKGAGVTAAAWLRRCVVEGLRAEKSA